MAKSRTPEQQRRDAVRIAVFRWLLDGGDEEEDEDDDELEEEEHDEGESLEDVPREAVQPLLFLSLFRRADPAPPVFEALRGREELIRPYSEAREQDYCYFDADGNRGSVLVVNRIEWIDDRTAETTAGMHAGPRAAFSNRLRVQERDGEWVVEDLGLEWIS